MDKIWYRNPSKSEVIGRGGGGEKPAWPRRTDKSRTLKNNNYYYFFVIVLLTSRKQHLDMCTFKAEK